MNSSELLPTDAPILPERVQGKGKERGEGGGLTVAAGGQIQAGQDTQLAPMNLAPLQDASIPDMQFLEAYIFRL